MKFSIVAAALIGLASYVTANDYPHFFTLPHEGSEFYMDDEITFVTNDITNDYDEGIVVKLFNADDGVEVKEIGVFTGEDIYRHDEDDDWVFTWVVDEPEGNYFVRAYEQDDHGVVDFDDDDINRSFEFTIKGYGENLLKTKRAHLKRSKKMKRKAQALKLSGL